MASITKLAEEDGAYRRVGSVPANPMKHRGMIVKKFVFDILLLK